MQEYMESLGLIIDVKFKKFDAIALSKSNASN
jgi:hypothetical protein